jgi:hypothetical protein
MLPALRIEHGASSFARHEPVARIATVLVLFALGLLGCSSGSDDVLSFDPNDAVFTSFSDPNSGFSTTDILDVDNEVVRLDAAAQVLVFKGQAFTGWPVSGNQFGPNNEFQVRFGTVGGTPHAFFTETGPATICDVETLNEELSISPTAMTVPQT